MFRDKRPSLQIETARGVLQLDNKLETAHKRAQGDMLVKPVPAGLICNLGAGCAVRELVTLDAARFHLLRAGWPSVLCRHEFGTVATNNGCAHVTLRRLLES